MKEINSFSAVNLLENLDFTPDIETLIVVKFLDEVCLIDLDYREENKKVYAAYSNWCEKNHADALGKGRFGKVLTNLGLFAKSSNNSYWRMCLKLKVFKYTRPDMDLDSLLSHINR